MCKKLFPVTLLSLMVVTLPIVVAADAGASEQFSLSSPDLVAGKSMSSTQVFNGMGCKGGNLSPALTWKNAPAATKSFAITAYDPDAPTGSGWWHWVVFNIPASTHAVNAGAGAAEHGRLPQGAIQSRTDFGMPGYGGACPPPGSNPHRYQFTVYALDVDALPLSADSSAAMVGFNLHAHKLASAQIEVLYSR